jgi:opacity protein-like surface antigen
MKLVRWLASTALVFALCNSNIMAQLNKTRQDKTAKPDTEIKKDESENNTKGEASQAEKDEKKGFSKDKIIYGGNLGLSFGTRTYIEVAPVLGYRFHPKISAGLSGNYSYQRESYIDQATRLNAFTMLQNFGTGAWGRFIVYKDIFAVSEFQLNKIKFLQNIPNNSVDFESGWYQSLLIGAGLRQRITDRVSMNLVVMYDVLQEYPLYKNQPIIRGGITAGF